MGWIVLGLDKEGGPPIRKTDLGLMYLLLTVAG